MRSLRLLLADLAEAHLLGADREEGVAGRQPALDVESVERVRLDRLVAEVQVAQRPAGVGERASVRGVATSGMRGSIFFRSAA